MLINFKFKNFKTFKEETEFSFIKGQKRELSNHIIKFNNKYNLLPIKVVYGSNASGKTNLLLAFQVLKRSIIGKSIRFDKDDFVGLCPNFDSLKDYETPIEFELTFTIDENKYQYILSFINYYKSMESEIVIEKLLENDKIVFFRNKGKVKLSDDEDIINEHYKLLLEKNNMNLILEMLENNINKTDTFTKWYSNIDNKLCEKIFKYFLNMTTITDLEDFKINDYIKIENKDKLYEDKRINKLLNELKVGKEKLCFKSDENGVVNNFISYKSDVDNLHITAPINTVESKGTIKMIDLLYPIINSLENGFPIFIDELDASIHHEIIYNIIQTFGDPSVNKKGAQLVFTTHNPVYLNKNLLRRDEIVFIEKDKKGSHLNTLENYNLRNDEVYLKNYLNGNYTILPNFDLNHIIE